MKIKQLLFSALFLLGASGSAFAQSSLYVGTFYNTTQTQMGVTSMNMTITLPDSIKGYMNFTELPTASPLCGAGYYKGRIVADSFALSFSSNDTDSRCGYDYGWLFTIKGHFYQNNDSISGEYLTHNSLNEGGFFHLIRVPRTTEVGKVNKLQAVVYPNPVSNEFVIKLPEFTPGAEAIITDQLGKTVLVKQLTGKITTIDLDVADGIYFLKIASGGMQSAQKLVVRH